MEQLKQYNLNQCQFSQVPFKCPFVNASHVLIEHKLLTKLLVYTSSNYVKPLHHNSQKLYQYISVLLIFDLFWLVLSDAE